MSTDYPFRSLVFEGGGTLGIAYVGVMEELEKRNIPGRIERVGGASSGAINALLFVLGYSSKEVWEQLLKLNLNSLLDSSLPFKADIYFRLFNAYGLYRGEFFKKWISGLISAKNFSPRITFKELHETRLPDLYLVGTNLSTDYYDIYSFEHSPDIAVVDALRISMSIPLLFAAVRGPRGDTLVDGGVLDNYPVRLFDQEKYILDLKKNPTHCAVPGFYKKLKKTSAAAAFNFIYNRETLGFRLARPQGTPVGSPAQPVPHAKNRQPLAVPASNCGCLSKRTEHFPS